MADKKPKGPVVTLKAATEAGYFGVKADPRPNSDYSLESGPDAPPNAVDGEAADYIKHRSRSNA